MASKTFTKLNHIYPAGTTVQVHPVLGRRDGAAPITAQVTSAVVAADGSVTFAGLVLNTKYIAYALVAAAHRYVNFEVRESGASSRRAAQVGISLVDVTVDLPSILANTTTDVNVALPAGTCKVGDLVTQVFLPTLLHGLVIQGVGIVAADSLRLRVSNTTAGALDAAAQQILAAIIAV